MNTQNLPSVAAVDAAFKAAAIWDKGASIAVISFNRKVYAARESLGHIFVEELNTNKIANQGYRNIEGANSVIVLAQVLDQFQVPCEVDYSLALEIAFLTFDRPNFNAGVEEVASWANGVIRQGMGQGLPQQSFAIALAARAYGFNEEDAINAAKLFEQRQGLGGTTTIDVVYSLIAEKSAEQASGWEEDYGYDPAREI